jgi:hypothetical protein
MIIIGLCKLLPMHNRGEIDVMDREALQEAISRIADPMVGYRKHINWIFWIVITFFIFR